MEEINMRNVVRFINAADEFLSRYDPEGKTKLGYAIRRTKPQATKLYEGYLSQVEDLRVDNCLTEGDGGAIKKDPQGNLAFSREGLKKFNAQHRDLLDASVTIEPYFATTLPKDMPANIFDAMVNFTIRPEQFTEPEGADEDEAEKAAA
jgi:hypothetical protein